MDVTGVQSSLIAGQANDKTRNDALDKEAFMKLLVAQLQNQDPLDPMDSMESITQLSQLTSVEKLSGIEDRLAGLEQTSQVSAGLETHRLIGKTVAADTSHGSLSQLGPSTISFDLESPAEQVTLRIRDFQGEVIKEITTGGLLAGPQQVSWDGFNASGDRQPPGTYYFDVKASSADGTSIPAHMQVQGVVTGVNFNSGRAELELGDTRVTLDNVKEIK